MRTALLSKDRDCPMIATLFSWNLSTKAVTWDTDGRMIWPLGEPPVADLEEVAFGDLNDPFEEFDPSLLLILTDLGEVGFDPPAAERAPLSSMVPALNVDTEPDGSGATVDSGEDWLVIVVSSVREVLSSMEL